MARIKTEVELLKELIKVEGEYQKAYRSDPNSAHTSLLLQYKDQLSDWVNDYDLYLDYMGVNNNPPPAPTPTPTPPTPSPNGGPTPTPAPTPRPPSRQGKLSKAMDRMNDAIYGGRTVNPAKMVGKAALSGTKGLFKVGRIAAAVGLAMPLALARNVVAENFNQSGFNTVYKGAGGIFRSISGLGNKKGRKGKRGKGGSYESGGGGGSANLKNSMDELRKSIDELNHAILNIGGVSGSSQHSNLVNATNPLGAGGPTPTPTPVVARTGIMGAFDKMIQALKDFKDGKFKGSGFERWLGSWFIRGGVIALGFEALLNGKDSVLAKGFDLAGKLIFGEDNMKSFYDKMKDIFGEGASTIGDYIARAAGAYAGLRALPGGKKIVETLIHKPVAMAYSGIEAGASWAGGHLKTAGAAAWDKIKDVGGVAWDKIKDLGGKGWDAAKDSVSKSMTALTDKLTDWANDFAKIVSKGASSVGAYIKSLGPKFTAFYDDLMKGLNNMIPEFKKMPQRGPNGTFVKGSSVLVDLNRSAIGQQILENADNPFFKAMDKTYNAMKDGAKAVASKVPSSIVRITPSGAAAGKALKVGLPVIGAGIEAYRGYGMWNENEEKYRAGLISQAEYEKNKVKAIAQPTASFAGGMAGAWAGGEIGAIGGMAVGGPIGAAIGGVGGAILGGVGVGYYADKAAGAATDWWYGDQPKPELIAKPSEKVRSVVEKSSAPTPPIIIDNSKTTVVGGSGGDTPSLAVRGGGGSSGMGVGAATQPRNVLSDLLFPRNLVPQ